MNDPTEPIFLELAPETNRNPAVMVVRSVDRKTRRRFWCAQASVVDFGNTPTARGFTSFSHPKCVVIVS